MQYLVKNKGLNRQQRRAQYAVPSRSKPYCRPRHPVKKFNALMKCRFLLEKFWSDYFKRREHEHQLFLVRNVEPSPIATAVKRAIQTARSLIS